MTVRGRAGFSALGVVGVEGYGGKEDAAGVVGVVGMGGRRECGGGAFEPDCCIIIKFIIFLAELVRTRSSFLFSF